MPTRRPPHDGAPASGAGPPPPQEHPSGPLPAAPAPGAAVSHAPAGLLRARCARPSGAGALVHGHAQLLRVRGRSVAWLPPLVLLLAIAALDWATAGDFRTISWVVLVPGVAAAICGLGGTVAAAVLAVVTYELEDHAWPHQFRTGLPDLILVVLGGLLAVLACAVRLRGERRMLHMEDIAETTRRAVLRPLPAGWGGLDHAAVYLAADSVARVGGDFYDIQPGPWGTRVLLGDVQGKGLGAVEAAAALLGTFREAAYHEPLLGTVADRLEARMLRHVRYGAAIGRDEGDRFATAVLFGFPPADPSHVEFLNFGHEPALVVTPGGIRSLPCGGRLPLGFGDLDGPPAGPLRVPFTPGETLLLVTDGVSQARDTTGCFYPLRDQVARAVAEDPRAAEPVRLVGLVRDGTLRHCAGRLDDDTTIFALRRPGAPGGA